jgi:RNase H-fold protein (predicted Holliday junction resolvase)
MYLGFDPGRNKCGVAVVDRDRRLVCHEVVPSEQAISRVQQLLDQHRIEQIIMGDQTSSKIWQRQFLAALPNITLQIVDERYSSLEARDRYWQMYPPKGITALLPKGMRQPPRPIDDIVAVLLIERYLQQA